MTRGRLAVLLPLLAAALACEGEATIEGEPAGLRLASVEPSVWLPGTEVAIRAETFLPDDRVFLTVSGRVAGNDVTAAFPLEILDARSARGVVSDDLFAAGEGAFEGTLTLGVVRGGQGLTGEVRTRLQLVAHLAPFVSRVGSQAAYFGDPIELEGDGFLLGQEGRSELLIDGTFQPDDGSAALEVRGVTVPGEATARGRLQAIHRPSLFGLRAGTFTGSLTVRNVHRDGVGYDAIPVPLTLASLPPAVFDVQPRTAGRGQYLRFSGGGFYEEPADAVSSLVRLHGTFTRSDGTQETWRAVELAGRIDPGELAVVLAPRGNRSLFGGVQGSFRGTASIVVTRGTDSVEGPDTPIELTIGPTRQAVFLKFLPGFADGLRRFGLKNAERAVRDRILAVCRRDYDFVAIEFTEERPERDFAEYSVIELTGPDPNGAGLFGLDNTEGKDDGNERLDDVIGGRNASSEESGSYAFGGVFLDSFLALSPSLPEPNPLASARFDEIFGAFAPELGGRPVDVSELQGGERQADLAVAVLVLGNLVGGTVVHEIGHSLGLAQVPGDPTAFHDSGDVPGLIMNPGAARSFEERAELDGRRASWADHDRAYLERTLPLR